MLYYSAYLFWRDVTLQNMVLIFLGCGLGGLLRYWGSTLAYSWFGYGFPYGTLLVNVSGSFLMGLLFVVIQGRWDGGMAIGLRAFLLIGLLGGYTTFSSFSIETLNLIESANYVGAALNIFLSVILCLGGVWLGVILGRQV